MNQAILIIAVNLLVLIALIVVKTKFFLLATRRRSFSRWLHFSQYHIIEASDDKTRKLRQQQNTYTTCIIVLTLLLFIFVYLAMKEMI